MILRLPRGYRRLTDVSPLAVAHEQYADVIAGIRSTGTLYDWAAAHPERREYSGRGPVWSAPLPNGGPRVVVRHARRGGLLAHFVRDLYVPPTPAFSEVLIASLLARSGVPTPTVIAFATYRAAGVLRRVDVMSLEVNGLDLAATLATHPTVEARAQIQRALARLFGAMLDAGAWHQDLNAKNILISTDAQGQCQAVVLDVDRVRFVPAGDPHMGAANMDRLKRSMDKFRARGAPALTHEELAEVETLIGSQELSRAQERATALEGYMP